VSWAKRGRPETVEEGEEGEEGEEEGGGVELLLLLLLLLPLLSFPRRDTDRTRNDATANAAVTFPLDRCVQTTIPTQHHVATAALALVGGVIPAPPTSPWLVTRPAYSTDAW